MSDHAISGVMALGATRGAVATLEHVLALPDFAADAIVVVGDLDDYPGKRETYRRLFTTLGRARRGVVWAPGPVDGALAREVRWAYEAAWPLPAAEPRGSSATERPHRGAHADVRAPPRGPRRTSRGLPCAGARAPAMGGVVKPQGPGCRLAPRGINGLDLHALALRLLRLRDANGEARLR